MVTTVTSYTDSRNHAYAGEGYDGVVKLSVAGHYGTGVLLYDGKAILTAAHLFSTNATNATAANIQFETLTGTQTIAASRISVMPSYDATQGNDDLALVWLTGSAPLAANRYNLYRSSDEIGQTLTMVGYGIPGTGASGNLTSYAAPPVRLKASNQFDADIGTLKNALGSIMAWSPNAGTQLIADFDNGNTAQDALGHLINVAGTGLGQDEGLTSAGDSGGPAFLNGQIAGITSYTTRLSNGSKHPDIDSAANNSFGEIASWQRVSHYQQWIDQSLRAQYTNAPTKPSEVQKAVPEGNNSMTYAYFLLQFNGMRSDPSQTLSVNYATRDGTAQAGSDYIAASGKLMLYPGENQAVIPVEIVGDTSSEPNETFYLDVTNPDGGNFGEGVVKLTAMRTIVNDDGGIWG